MNKFSLWQVKDGNHYVYNANGRFVRFSRNKNVTIALLTEKELLPIREKFTNKGISTFINRSGNNSIGI